MSAFEASSIKRILLLRWGALGDLALCSAVFEDVCSRFPEAQIDLNVDPVWSSIFIGDNRFSRVIDQKIRGERFLKSVYQWLKMLKQGRYDLIIDFQSNDRSRAYLAIATWMGMAPKYRISTQNAYPYNVSVQPVSATTHALEVFRVPLRALDISPTQSIPLIQVESEEIDAVSRLMAEEDLLNKTFVLLVPGSSQSGKNKRWGESNYIELGKALTTERYVEKVAILGGPDEMDLCQSISNGIGDNAINLAGKTTLPSIIPLVRASAGLVANDTGLAHLAAAANKPVVVICGPTLAERVKPAGDHVKALQVPVECFAKQSASECMKQVTVSMILKCLF